MNIDFIVNIIFVLVACNFGKLTYFIALIIIKWCQEVYLIRQKYNFNFKDCVWNGILFDLTCTNNFIYYFIKAGIYNWPRWRSRQRVSLII